ncbi:MAG: hypothetical protein ACI8PZ_003952 [Myxococcota bacterium]|jgi:hypothetical protein
MAHTLDEQTAATRASLLDAKGLSAQTPLYRATYPEHISQADGSGGHSITANPDAGEAVVDIYHQGHTIVASDAGPGLALTTARDNEWDEPDRVVVEVLLGDVLAQGGLVYDVTSVLTEQVLYCTLPSGTVSVRVLDR